MMESGTNQRPRATKARRARRGFTLLELIVASTILVIITTVALPRFLVVESQREEKAIIAVEDLMRMYAFRNTTGMQQVSLHHDVGARTISLWIMDLNPADLDGPRIWQQDRLSTAVELPEGMTVDRALADGEPMSDDGWTIATNPDGSRPRVEIILVGRERQAHLVLETYTNSPVRADDPRARVLQPIDLDAEGGAYDPW
jgi:prepilin-type N-terminal cleavage/methylation domain-containing protein